MITKLFEIRDKGTFVPVLAIKLSPSCEPDRYLLGRAGFGTTEEQQGKYIFVSRIDGGEGKGTSDPYNWGGVARTLPVSHAYIAEHFDNLESGTVVDVEFILGETKKPKEPERLTP